MGGVMKKLLIFLIVFSIKFYAQFEVLKQFPVSYNISSLEYIPKMTIYDLGDEHLLAFYARDSLFCRHSYDNGETWESETLIYPTNYRVQHMDIIKQNNKIIITFNTGSAKVITSTDDGETCNEEDDSFEIINN